MSSLKAFDGPLRKLVLAFDVGTTFSGVGYAILDPDAIPNIQAVTRFPGQGNGDAKIPSIICYTADGQLEAVGAEAHAVQAKLAADDKSVVFAEWFKLHFCPPAMLKRANAETYLRPLPLDKTIETVFADMLSYLFECARKYIIESNPSGQSLWDSVEPRIEFILSHPNGWEGAQQSQMRRAAIEAKLVPDTAEGRQRVHFVTEGEASLYYCIDKGLAKTAIKDKSSVLVIDAGGGTIDLSAYGFTSSSPIAAEELAATGCILEGSTMVNVRAQKFLTAKLKGSKFGSKDDIKEMVELFDKSIKPVFECSTEPSVIKFGRARDTDVAFDIKSGRLTLQGREVKQFFEPSVAAIISAIREQRLKAARPISLAFLVGGFAASPWLFAQVKDALSGMDIDLSRPDSHTNKAVAEGAVSFYLQGLVSARVARWTYGTDYAVDYDQMDDEHFARRWRKAELFCGREVIPGAFCTILAKGTQVRHSQALRNTFFREIATPMRLNHITADIMRYEGESDEPRWLDKEPNCFTTLCTVSADTSLVATTVCMTPRGLFFRQIFDVVLLCGQTEMKAQISWMNEGEEKRGPAEIIYDAAKDE